MHGFVHRLDARPNKRASVSLAGGVEGARGPRGGRLGANGRTRLRFLVRVEERVACRFGKNSNVAVAETAAMCWHLCVGRVGSFRHVSPMASSSFGRERPMADWLRSRARPSAAGGDVRGCSRPRQRLDIYGGTRGRTTQQPTDESGGWITAAGLPSAASGRWWLLLCAGVAAVPWPMANWR